MKNGDKTMALMSGMAGFRVIHPSKEAIDGKFKAVIRKINNTGYLTEEGMEVIMLQSTRRYL